MTASAFAELVQARTAGRGRWQAKCPAHLDKSPSLAIKEGQDGRVLLRCWAGCETHSILAALRLTMRDLFSGDPADPAAIQEARRERSEREATERKHAGTERQLTDYVRRGHFAVMALGARLHRYPQEDTTALLFHTALDWLRIGERGLGCDA
jgi:hypothetical protein